MTSFDPSRARELLELHRPYHSEFQIDHFITGRAGLTTWGMFLQALRELSTRFEGLKALKAERGLAEIEVIRQERKSKLGDDLDRAEAAIRQEQAVMRLEGLDRNIRDTWRELQRFYAQANALRAALPQELTDDVRASLERDRWVALLKRQAAIELMTTGRVGPGTVESIWSLPAALRAMVLGPMADPTSLIAECESFEPALPDVDVAALPGAEVAKILEACGA